MGNKREKYQRRFPYNYEGRKAQQARIRGLNLTTKRDENGNFTKAPLPLVGFHMTAPSGERTFGRHADESIENYIRRLRAAGATKQAKIVEERLGRTV